MVERKRHPRDDWGSDERGIERIAALSDGVFAIAITLLVLNLRVPELPDTFTSEQVQTELQAQLPNLFSFALSFVVLGTYWIGHHRHLFYVRRYDRGFLWCNIAFLAFVSLLPYPTALLGTFAPDRLVVILYALTIVVLGSLSIVLWHYATRGHRLVDPGLSQQVNLEVLQPSYLATAVFAGSILVALFDPTIAMCTWALNWVLGRGLRWWYRRS